MAIKTFDTSGEGDRGTRSDTEGAGQPAIGEIADWAPGEFCVVYSFEAQPEGILPGPELYDLLLDRLRAELRQLARALLDPDQASRERLELFPVPPELLARLAPDPTPEQPEALQSPDRLRQLGLDPWLTFPRASGQALSQATRLHFYTVPQVPPLKQQAPSEAPPVWPGIDAALGLTNLVNGHLLRGFGLAGRQISLTDSRQRVWVANLQAAHPNWLFTGADDGDGGSPASLPEPAGDGKWGFRFLTRRLAAKLAKADESRVLIAVLDTSPSRQVVADAAARYPHNWLLRVISQEVQPGGRFVVDRDEPTPLLPNTYYDPSFLEGLYADLLTQRPDPAVDQAHYKMADHGLFVAGIIRSIAPFAEIRLIRALSDFGLGDMFAVAKILEQLPGLMRNGKDRLVVNLSLGADVPHPEDYLLLVHPALCRLLGVSAGQLRRDALGQLEALAQPTSPVASQAQDALLLLQRSRLGLAEAISWLTSADGAVATTALRHRPLVVAAAGNDFDNIKAMRTGVGRQDPRLPGGFNEVLSVAALNRYFGPSRFTNLGDERPLRDGVATFGGDATRAGEGELPRIVGSDVGVVSVFSAADIPLPEKGQAPKLNTSGWVQWSGTSFATPIISAVAARLWARHPGLEPLDAAATAGWPGGGPPRTLTELILSFTPTGGYPPGPPLFADHLHVEQTQW